MEIDPEKFTASVGPDTLVIIEGEFDKSLIKSPKIEVETLTIAPQK